MHPRIRDMRKNRRIIPMIFITLCMTLTINQAMAKRYSRAVNKLYKRSVALVIGINEYEHGWSPLSEAASDANRLAQTLSDQGFDVTLLLNDAASKSEILRILQTELPSKLTPKTRFLFYFAGHGQTYKTPSGVNQGFIIPVDGQLQSDRDGLHTYISMSELKEVFTSYLPSKHNTIIFDSCFSGIMLTRGLKANRNPLKSKKLEYGVSILTAGSQNEKATDGLFTPTLIEGLKGSADRNQDGIVSFNELAIFTRRQVQDANPGQNPQFGNLAGDGQMIFSRMIRSSKGKISIAGSARNKAKREHRSVFVSQKSDRSSLFIQDTQKISLRLGDVQLNQCGVKSLASQALGLAQHLGQEFCGDITNRFMRRGQAIYDKFLKLSWHRMSYEKVSYEDAETRCKNRGEQYRLPTLSELASLITSDRTKVGYMPESINPLKEVWLWAQSPLNDSGQQASIDFSAGQAYQEYFKNLRAFMCVSSQP